ncbi:MAG TPA: hypothetical protein VHA82_06390 [Ramlibacter sp.]|uniref:hypothetical protein n=1 Tax=Ramlibacter sp. TaxID=1917967 RepID=UPI002C97758A|nr:hypothetical protein [Ramlibacter sp.]HVZ43423.1 hypothetical protein [Ramlibacter sp.]
MPRRALVSIIVVLAALLIAAVLNPSPERHRQKIRDAVAERSPLAGALGLGSLTAFASNYHSLVVASYTTAGDKTLSVGFLGMVFVSNP